MQFDQIEITLNMTYGDQRKQRFEESRYYFKKNCEKSDNESIEIIALKTVRHVNAALACTVAYLDLGSEEGFFETKKNQFVKSFVSC